MSCRKSVFPSHYLRLPILDVPSPVVTSSSPSHYLSLFILEVPCHVENSSSHLITCHFPSWMSVFSRKSHVMCKFDHLFPCHLSKKWKKYLPVRSAHNSHVMCKKTKQNRYINPMSCAKKPRLNRPQSTVSSAPTYIYIYVYINVYKRILIDINRY